MIKVSDGRHTTKRHKTKIKELGLIFKPTGKTTGYWYTTDDSKAKKIQKFCKKYKLTYDFEDNRYSRSSTYREDFFKANKGYKHNGRTYHCAYCGKKLSKQKVEVDHVIAVNAVKKHLLARFFLFLTGITNVNDPKNLVAACRKCNRKKSSKQGLWVLRGYLGRHIWVWRTYRLIVLLLIILLIYIIYNNYL